MGGNAKIKTSTSLGGLRSSVEALFLDSCLAVRATTAGVDYTALAAHQKSCPLTQRAVSSSTSLQIQEADVGGIRLLCDVPASGLCRCYCRLPLPGTPRSPGDKAPDGVQGHLEGHEMRRIERKREGQNGGEKYKDVDGRTGRRGKKQMGREGKRGERA